jgi:hypothetical protein
MQLSMLPNQYDGTALEGAKMLDFEQIPMVRFVLLFTSA